MEAPRRLLAATLILAPLLGLAASLGFQGTGDIADEMRFIRENEARWLVFTGLWLASAFLWVPAALGIAMLVPARLRAWGLAGVGLLIVGAVAHGNVVAYSLAQVPLAQSALDPAAVDAFVADEMYAHAAFVMVLAPFAAFQIAPPFLGVLLWRARVAPLWVPIVLAAAIVVNFATQHAVKNELVFILMTAGFGYFGVKLWRSSARIRPDEPATPA